MTIIDKLYANYAQFSVAEQKIADYILDVPSDIPNMTIAELAQASQVSEASISRFCRKMKVVGFHALKIELAQISLPATKVTENQSILKQRLAHIEQNKIAEIEQTIGQLDEVKMNEILNKFRSAPRVIFLAYGNTIPVAMDAAYRFNQIGISAIAFDIWDTALSYLLTSKPEDLIVVISNSGETKALLSAVNWCKKNEQFVLALTNNQNSPLALQADRHLLTATRERLFQKEYYFSRISAMLVIETIFLLLAFEEPDRLEQVKRHEQMISDSKI